MNQAELILLLVKIWGSVGALVALAFLSFGGNSHNLFALIMPVLIVGIIAAGLSVRQTWPVDVAPVQLTEPGQ